MDKKFIGVIGGALIVISAFLPWMGMLGISFSGIGHPDGPVFGLIAVAFGAMVGGFAFLSKKWSNILAIIIAFFELGYMALLLSAVSERNMDAGMGLYIGLVGAIVGIVGCVISMRQPKATESIA
ncbi:MAG: hypothetical protein GY810_28580 [Aureispira sp.]|nr:hypothetical protein [Aureispira sp.]